MDAGCIEGSSPVSRLTGLYRNDGVGIDSRTSLVNRVLHTDTPTWRKGCDPTQRLLPTRQRTGDF